MHDHGLLYPLLAEAASTPVWETVLKIASAVGGLLGVGFGIYMALLNRKLKREKEHQTEKEKTLQLTIDRKLEELRGQIKDQLAQLSTDASNASLRLQQIEQALGSAADTSAMTSLKYTVETDVSELKGALTRFSEACGKRHEQLAAHGSLSDLKARVDEVIRKISSLEDFRHASADRYVLVVNYQQDIKLITDTIGMLREDLRAVIELVDNL